MKSMGLGFRIDSPYTSVSLRNNQLKLETSVELLIILEKIIEYPFI